MEALDYCELHLQLRHEISNFDEEEKKLNTLRYWSGNEECITKLWKRLMNVLLEHELIKEMPHETRKDDLVYVPHPKANINMLRSAFVFLLLNSQNTYDCSEEDLQNANTHCVQLMNQCPLLPQLVTFIIAHKCGMSKIFNEFLACGPYWLTIQFWNICILNYDHLFNKLEVLGYVCENMKAIGNAIIAYAQRTGPESNSSKWLQLNENLLKLAARMLQGHVIFTEEGLKEQRGRGTYLAEAVEKILQANIFSLQLLYNPETAKQETEEYMPLYALHTPNVPTSNIVHDHFPIMHRFVDIQLNMLQSLMKAVRITDFMAWYEMPSSEVFYNRQQFIGVQMKNLYALLMQDAELCKHSIVHELPDYVLSAKTFSELLSELKIGELLAFVDGEKGKPSVNQLNDALLVLLQQHPIVFITEECIESIARHVKLLKTEHAQLILQHLHEAVQSKIDHELAASHYSDADEDSENESELKDMYSSVLEQVLAPIFTNCSSSDKLLLLAQRDKLQLLSHFNFQTPSFNAKRHTYFNNIKYYNLPRQPFLQLCYENPEDTWLSLAELAMTHETFARLYWSMVRQCIDHAKHHVDRIVVMLLENDFMLLRPNAENFLLQLYNFYIHVNSTLVFKRPIVHRQRGWQRKNRLVQQVNIRPSLLPYQEKELQFKQFNFLDSCTNSLCKFRESGNHTLILKIFQILNRIVAADRINHTDSRHQIAALRKMRKHCEQANNDSRKLSDMRNELKIGCSYAKLHAKLECWRLDDWELNKQVILAVDSLRSNLGEFDSNRISTLNAGVAYMHEFAFKYHTNFLKTLESLDKKLKFPSFWRGHTNLPTEPTLDNRDIHVEYLMLASKQEAELILVNAMRAGIDKEVMAKLAEVVDQQKSPAAMHGYAFIFICYLKAHKLHYASYKGKNLLALAKALMDIIRLSPREISDELVSKASDVFRKMRNAAPQSDVPKIDSLILASN